MLQKPKVCVALLIADYLLDFLLSLVRSSDGNCVASHKLTTRVWLMKPINVPTHSSKSFKATRTSYGRPKNMHFGFTARGDCEGPRPSQHQSERSLGMRLHVRSNIWLPFNQVAAPAALHAAAGGQERSIGTGQELWLGLHSHEDWIHPSSSSEVQLKHT